MKPGVGALCVASIAVLAMPSLAQTGAKATEKSYRIAVLSQGNPPTNEVPGADLRQGLRDWGYVDGRNVAVDFRYGAGKADKLPELADEIVRMKVDVIVTVGESAALAAKKATTSIPIVATEFGLDPVKAGLVSSLGRPDGNVTGLSSISDELWSKRLGLVRQIVPKMNRVAVMWNSTNPGNASCLAEIRAAGGAMGAQIQPVDVVDANAVQRAFAAIVRDPPDVLAVCWDSVTLEYAHAIADFAIKRKLATVAPLREYVKAGALLSFGNSLAAHRRRAAYYTDKIFKGVKPTDLPIERASTFELVVNAATAKALAVTVPPALGLIADELIEQEVK